MAKQSENCIQIVFLFFEITSSDWHHIKPWSGLTNPSGIFCNSSGDCDNQLEWNDGETFTAEPFMNRPFEIDAGQFCLRGHDQVTDGWCPNSSNKFYCQYECERGEEIACLSFLGFVFIICFLFFRWILSQFVLFKHSIGLWRAHGVIFQTLWYLWDFWWSRSPMPLWQCNLTQTPNWERISSSQKLLPRFKLLVDPFIPFTYLTLPFTGKGNPQSWFGLVNHPLEACGFTSGNCDSTLTWYTGHPFAYQSWMNFGYADTSSTSHKTFQLHDGSMKLSPYPETNGRLALCVSACGQGNKICE